MHCAVITCVVQQSLAGKYMRYSVDPRLLQGRLRVALTSWYWTLLGRTAAQSVMLDTRFYPRAICLASPCSNYCRMYGACSVWGV